METIYAAAVAAPIELKLADAHGQPPDLPATSCTAMIVCHGMGQQVPFETLDAVASAIADEHMGDGGTMSADRSVNVVLRFVRPVNSEKLYPRAEVTLRQAGQEDKTVHLYEAYWAPLTEGAISYTQTVVALLFAGINGFKESGRRVFNRWMFGEEKNLPIDRSTGRLLLAILAFAVPILLLPLLGFSLYGAIKGKAILSGYTLAVVALGLLWLWLRTLIRAWVVQYMGDVIVYVSGNEVNGYWKIRDEIKQIGLSLAKVVYGALNSGVSRAGSTSAEAPPQFLYSHVVVVVGHSLGSVIAYDTLNAIINQDLLDGSERKTVARTQALITLGSPLDKIAFLFRQKARDAFMRDVLSAAYQPMILDYDNRPRWWINIFCKTDIISGSLEYYDDPARASTEPRRVMNFRDPYALWNPKSAHTDYWKRPFTKTFLYLAARGEMEKATRAEFQHSSQHVPIRRFNQ